MKITRLRKKKELSSVPFKRLSFKSPKESYPNKLWSNIWKHQITASKLPRCELSRLYPNMSTAQIEKRLNDAIEGFSRVYGKAKPRLFSAPGRTELCGNHTDHQRGLVIAAAVNLDNIAAAVPNEEKVIRIYSEAHGSAAIEIDDLSPHSEEIGARQPLLFAELLNIL